jgi:hypothetical protein
MTWKKIVFTSTLYQNYIKITSVLLTPLCFFFDTTLMLLHYIILVPLWYSFDIIVTIRILMSIDCYDDTIIIRLYYNITMIIFITCACYFFVYFTSLQYCILH